MPRHTSPLMPKGEGYGCAPFGYAISPASGGNLWIPASAGMTWGTIIPTWFTPLRLY